MSTAQAHAARDVATGLDPSERPTAPPPAAPGRLAPPPDTIVAPCRRNRSVLVDRDIQMLLALHEARYLSRDQLERLFFPGRAASTSKVRLWQLAGEGGARDQRFIERHQYATAAKVTGCESVWSLAKHGYWRVERVLGNVRRERHALEPEYFEHHLSFTELYVRLLQADADRRLAAVQQTQSSKARNRALASVYARVNHPEWRWLVMGDDLELPWKQYAVNSGKAYDRVIRPDAILELPRQRRRLFFEGETGSHSIQARSPEKKGATMAKVARYAEYVETFESPADRRTWYAQRFTDGFAPEVLFLVPNETRAANIRKAVAQWQRGQLTPPRLVVHAMTVENAAAFLLPYTTVAAAPARAAAATAGRETTLSAADQKTIVEFFEHLRTDLHTRMRAAQLQRGPMPQRPPLYYELKAIVVRLNPPLAQS